MMPPFVAVELNCQGFEQDQRLYFRTNMDDVVLAGDDNPLIVEVNPGNGEPSPYLAVKDGLTAKLSRPVYYQLADLAVEIPSPEGICYMVTSNGARFQLK